MFIKNKRFKFFTLIVLAILVLLTLSSVSGHDVSISKSSSIQGALDEISDNDDEINHLNLDSGQYNQTEIIIGGGGKIILVVKL